MAHVCRLARGNDTLNLANGTDNIYLVRYTPLAPELSAEEIQYLADGGDISALSYLNVTEPVTLRFWHATRATALTAKDNFEAYVHDAIEYQRSDGEEGAQVYIEIQPGSSGNVWRSELLFAPPRLEEGALGARWAANSFYATFQWRRRFYWERNGLVPLLLTNPQGSEYLQTIYNPNPRRQAANTISFDSATKTISDSGNGLTAFKDHQKIHVVGSAANDGTYTVAEGGGGALGTIVVEEALTDESADPGVTVTIIGPPTNYVDLPVSTLTGTLPAPANVYISNSTNDADEMTKIWIGHNVFSDPDNMEHVWEAEDADSILGSPVATPSADCSGGAYMTVTEAGSAEVCMFRYNLTSAELEDLNAKRFRFLAKFVGAIPAMYVRLAVTYPAGSTTTELESGDTVLLNTDDLTQEIGELQLPPWLTKLSNWQGVSVCVYGRKTGGFTLNVDFFQPTPTHSFRRLVPASGGVEYEESLVDEGSSGEVYHRAVSTLAKAAFYEASGSDCIMLYPGRAQRLYFLHESDGTEIDRVLQLQVQTYLRRMDPL